MRAGWVQGWLDALWNGWWVCWVGVWLVGMLLLEGEGGIVVCWWWMGLGGISVSPVN